MSTDKDVRTASASEPVAIDHEFKSHPDVFWPAARGEKTFEYRRDDRGGYEVGQTVRLRLWHGDTGYADVPPLDRRITNILRGGEFELPQGYCILGLAPLEPAALDDRLRAAGMFTIPEMMGTTPLTRWQTHAAMKNLDAFDCWLDVQVRQFLTMRMHYEIGDNDKSDELYEWVLAHAAAYQVIRTNFKAARAAETSTPNSPRTGDEGTDHARLARELMGFHHALDGGVGDGAIAIRCESETEQTRLALRAVLREAAAIVSAAHPAAPEAQGASSPIPAEATEAMWQAGRAADTHPGDSHGAIWRAMVAAAPPSSGQEG